MKISAIILAHEKAREGNIKKIVDSLISGTETPQGIVVFIDNPNIEYQDSRVTVVKSNKGYPVIIRFALGLCEDADRILMIDDDLMVGPKTIENFVKYANKYPEHLLGLEGNILGEDEVEPYTLGESVDRGSHVRSVDVLIRTYFVTPMHLLQALWTKELFKNQLPERSIDDIILCMSNKYEYSGQNIVIPIDKDSDVIELDSKGVGQCLDINHYINRNIACNLLK